MPKFILKDEAPFIVNARNFSVGYSATGYTLQYSVDGKNFTSWPEATPKQETLVVNGVTSGSVFRLLGNVGEVEVLYESN